MTEWPTLPGKVDASDITASWQEWADGASLAAEPALALRLRDQDLDGHELSHVRDLVLLGRGAQALDLLATLGVSPPGEGDDLEWSHLLFAAARALTGERAAYDWLLAAGTPVYQGGAVQVGVLLASLADTCQDPVTADRIWYELGVDFGVGAPQHLARFCVAVLSRRDRHNLDAIVESVAGAAKSLVEHTPDAAADPGPAVSAANQLAARGDVAGATLLLRVTHRFDPRAREVRAALREHSRGLRSMNMAAVAVALLIVALGAAMAFSPEQRLRSPLFVIGALAAYGYMPLTGFTRHETSLWRWSWQINRLRPNGELTTSIAGWCTLALVMGGMLGVLIAMTITTPSADAVSERERWLTGPGSGVVWIVSIIVCAGLPMTLIALGARSLRAKRWRDAAADRRAEQEAAARRCQCVHLVWDDLPLARVRVESHLERVETSPAQRDAEAALGTGSVLRCPSTGHVWLYGPLGESGRVLLLRGAPAKPQEPSTITPGLYL